MGITLRGLCRPGTRQPMDVDGATPIASFQPSGREAIQRGSTSVGGPGHGCCVQGLVKRRDHSVDAGLGSARRD